jgi:hypothetical protein
MKVESEVREAAYRFVVRQNKKPSFDLHIPKKGVFRCLIFPGCHCGHFYHIAIGQ